MRSKQFLSEISQLAKVQIFSRHNRSTRHFKAPEDWWIHLEKSGIIKDSSNKHKVCLSMLNGNTLSTKVTPAECPLPLSARSCRSRSSFSEICFVRLFFIIGTAALNQVEVTVFRWGWLPRDITQRTKISLQILHAGFVLTSQNYCSRPPKPLFPSPGQNLAETWTLQSKYNREIVSKWKIQED